MVYWWYWYLGLAQFLIRLVKHEYTPDLGEKANKETSKAKNTEANKRDNPNKQINEPIIQINGRNLNAMDI